MRLSLPRWSRTADHVVIRDAEAIAYRVPMDLTSDSTDRTTAPFNYLISITGVSETGHFFTGLGEAQPRPNQTDDAHESSWPFLEEQLRRLNGEHIDVVHIIDDVRLRTARLEEAAGLADHGESPRFRATIAGIEAALLDLAAKARGLTLTDLLGRRTLRTTAFAPLLRRSEPESVVAHFHSNRARRPDAIRILGDDDAQASLEHLRQVAAIRRTLRPHASRAPIWMNFRGRLPAAAAEDTLRTIVRWAGEQLLPPTLVLQHVLPRDAQEGSPRLQGLVDDLAAAYDAGLDIRLLPYSAGPAETSRLLRSPEGNLRMLNVRSNQIGGIVRTMDLIDEALQHEPHLDIVVTQAPGASKVTQMTQLDFTKALPHVAHASTSADVDRSFRVGRRVSQLHRTAFLREGNGLRINHHSLVKRARAQILVPDRTANHLDGATPNTYDDVDYISPIGSYAVHGHIVEREALARGFSSWRFTKSSIVVSDRNGTQLPFRTARWPLTGVVASSIARHKEATRLLLARSGVPVPEGRTFHGGDHDLALRYAEKIGYPVVLKPAEGSMGAGVTANIPNEGELITALELLAKTAHGTNEFIVEKHVNGNDYRIMVVGDRVFAAVQRIPANIVGDGRRTVGQLMIAENMLRRKNSHLGSLKIKWNAAVRHQLEKQGLTIDTVLPPGKQVFLLSTNNLTQGGDSVEILDDLHPSIQEACVRAVKAVPGMGYCGVDFLLEDHTKPLTEQQAAIVELNAMAALPVAEYPMYGTPRRISEEYITACVDAFGLDAWNERADHLDLRLTIRGGITGVGYGRWFKRRADRSGLSGWYRGTGDREAEARISGPTAAVTAMVTLAILGPPKAAPESVKSTHAEGPHPDGAFELLDQDGDDLDDALAIEPGEDSDTDDVDENMSRERELSLEDETDHRAQLVRPDTDASEDPDDSPATDADDMMGRVTDDDAAHD